MTETNLNDLIKKEIKCLSVIIDSAQMDPETQMISLEISITQFCLPLCWLHTQAGYPEMVAKTATYSFSPTLHQLSHRSGKFPSSSLYLGSNASHCNWYVHGNATIPLARTKSHAHLYTNCGGHRHSLGSSLDHTHILRAGEGSGRGVNNPSLLSHVD